MELNSGLTSNSATASPVAASGAPLLSRRSLQKEETHERIVRAALHLFERRGFAATRTQDIAEEAGISHGSIFVHFKTRDELLVHVCLRFLTAVDARTREALRGCASLESFLQGHLEALVPSEALYTRLLQELSGLPPEIRTALLENQSGVSAHLKMALRNNELLGLEPSEHHFLFNAWMGTLTHYLLNRDTFTTSDRLLEEQGSAIISLFLKLAHGGRGLNH
ncbi:MAG: TetR/AcrR family transcriptional regulator [Proteobacteria bacterium]|nr:MAG: TetR/AcrR family transcriptional regulator [Pseudomonadota bacterium]